MKLKIDKITDNELVFYREGTEQLPYLFRTGDTIEISGNKIITHRAEPPDMPLVLPDDDGIRPAGEPDECFYCNQKVGQPHKRECEILQKDVEVEVKIRMKIPVPYHWDKQMIEFARGASSWCADNIVDDINKFKDELNAKMECMCGYTDIVVVDMPNPAVPPYRTNDKDEIVP